MVVLAFGVFWGTGSAVDTDDVELEFHSPGFRHAPVTVTWIPGATATYV